MEKQEIFSKLKESIVEMDTDLAEEAANDALSAGIDPLEAISGGLSEGMAVMSEMFDEGEAFVPDLLMAAEAFETAVEILTSSLSEEEKNRASSGKVLIHTVEGDIHDIGKNIAKTMFAANNFEVIDLGRDVPVTTVVEKAEEHGVDLICGSALMTTTMAAQRDIINQLKEDGIRDKYLVMFGGAPVSAKWCEDIGADGYSDTASDGITVATELINEKRGA